MNWLERKIYLYNVTIGLYMLDWWERYLINTLLVVLMWFIINMVRRVSLNLLVPVIAVFCKSSLGYALSWLCSYSTVNDMGLLDNPFKKLQPSGMRGLREGCQ